MVEAAAVEAPVAEQVVAAAVAAPAVWEQEQGLMQSMQRPDLARHRSKRLFVQESAAFSV